MSEQTGPGSPEQWSAPPAPIQPTNDAAWTPPSAPRAPETPGLSGAPAASPSGGYGADQQWVPTPTAEYRPDAGAYATAQYPWQWSAPGYGPPAGPGGPKPGPSRGRRQFVAGVGVALAVVACVGAGYAIGRATSDHHGSTLTAGNGFGLGSGTDSGNGTGSGTGNGTGSGTGNGTGSGGNSYPGYPFPTLPGGLGSGTGNGTGSSGTAQATSAEQVGVVDIDTVLAYQSAEAAGTGTVVTSDGEILTNNHVVDGATKIQVTVVSTGKSYTAKVVGTDPGQDVAVLQLQDASGLATARYGDSGSVATGQKVTGVGNAGGVGGVPSAAAGSVVALNRSITASDDGSGANAEHLTGMVQTNADIQPGDSGGPLYNSADKIIGMDTAATQTGQAQTYGYAIPINHALSVAAQIESATKSTATIHVGYPGFLGVSINAGGTTGASVAGVVTGDPAAKAGVARGDLITAVNGTKVTSAGALQAAMIPYGPKDTVTLSWTDTTGSAHHAQVTLVTGPAD